jgi:hypothetical protein
VKENGNLNGEGNESGGENESDVQGCVSRGTETYGVTFCEEESV